jgi:hypothetical protein
LTDYQVILELIAGTTTATGLTVQAVLDTNAYPTGIEISDAELAAVSLASHDYHGEWNYDVHSGRTRKPRRTNKS